MVWRKVAENRPNPSRKTIFRNAKVTTGMPGEGDRQANCIVIEGSTIAWIGNEHDSQLQEAAQSSDTQEIDLHGQRLMPAFFDGHVHLLQFGISLAKIDIRPCESMQEVRQTIQEAARANPKAERLLVQGWRRAITGHDVNATTLDEIESRMAVFVDSDDLHACWCNTAALDAIDAANTPDPQGGRIVRDEDGKPTGILEEAAVFVIIWGYIIGAMTVAEKKAAISRAASTYNAAGYTSVVDMAMDEATWDVLHEMYRSGELTLRLAAHFLILPASTPPENEAQVSRVIELHKTFNLQTSPDFRIAGIKIITDGVVDGCTAALSHPYRNTNAFVHPIWSASALQPVLHQADAVGLQCALHAIGDAAVSLAVSGLSTLPPPPEGRRDRRHRIEHLELTSPSDAKRLGELGITASIQPVHCDPELNTTWPPLIGHSACSRAFAYGEFLQHGAKLAMGTDVPTAPHQPWNNLFNSTTRRSFRRPEGKETVNEHFKVGLGQALESVSFWPAWACFAEGRVGGLAVGKEADFIVVDGRGDWGREPETILEAKVVQTWMDGRRIC